MGIRKMVTPTSSFFNIVLLSDSPDWCQSMYVKLFQEAGAKLNYDFVRADGIVLMLHGHFWYEDYEKLNEMLKPYKWVIGIRTGDEEDRFQVTQINHPNIKWWVQYPVKSGDYGNARFIPIGVPDYFVLPKVMPEKDIDIFLSAQNTHVRRNQAFNVAERIEGNNFIQRTQGFSQGLPVEEYLDKALRSKVMPAPSGAISPDSFRLYEALEAGALPIADDISPRIDSEGFFRKIFPDAPFPIITDWTELPEIIKNHTPAKQKEINNWWTNYKKSLILNIENDIKELCKK